jgi:hypothetical protein
MSTPKEQVYSYIQTWLTNKYVVFFEMLMLGQEPSEVNPVLAIDTIVKYRYKMTEADFYILQKSVDAGNATDMQRSLYFMLLEGKKYALSVNKNFQNNFDTIYKMHKDLGTPFEGIMFHLYCFLKFGIKSKSSEHNFSSLLNCLLTKNIYLTEQLLEELNESSIRTKSPRFNTSKAKSKWIARAKEHNFEIKKRKVVLFKTQQNKEQKNN